MLPAIDPVTGQLPPGRHAATWAEVEQMFVMTAPCRPQRERTYSALVEWAALCRDLLPSSRLWIDGSFVTYRPAAPFDADVAVIAPLAEVRAIYDAVTSELAAAAAVPMGSSPEKCPTAVRFSGLWTMQSVSSRMPVANFPRVQPFGGHVDAFLLVEENLAELDVWDRNWSMSSGAVPKGYLEVST